MQKPIYLVTYSNFDSPSVYRLINREMAKEIIEEMKCEMLKQRPGCEIEEDEDAISFEWFEESADENYCMFGYILEEEENYYPKEIINLKGIMKFLRKNYNFQEETLHIISNSIKLIDEYCPDIGENSKADYILDVLEGFDIPRKDIEQYIALM